jgi:CBS domain containing-hemolysin-like protein
MGRIPAKGEEYCYKGATFSVLEADGRRIKKLKITIPREPEE